MTDDVLKECEGAIGHTFADKELLRLALTHPSSSEGVSHNERLEFLGDAVLGLLASERLYQRFEKEREGQLTQIKSSLVSARTLARATKGLGLDRFLELGKGMSNGESLSPKVLGNVFEAVLGAVYLDAGLEAARGFVTRALDGELARILAREHELNYKSMLQQHTQSQLRCTPTYEVHSETGPDHAKTFEVSVLVGERELGRGTGASKKDAEQLAARLAYERLIAEGEEESS
ncbi:MAG: ribonuclease III [Planctomycetota bacterium]